MPTFWKQGLQWNKPAKKKEVNPEDKVWTAFSEFIRLRDCLASVGNPNVFRCCTCKTLTPYKGNDAGHFITRSAAATKYDPRNVHAQCAKCNRFQQGRWDEYADFLEKEYGKGIVEELRAKKNELVVGFRDWSAEAQFYRDLKRALEFAYGMGIFGHTQEQVRKFVSGVRRTGCIHAFLEFEKEC